MGIPLLNFAKHLASYFLPLMIKANVAKPLIKVSDKICQSLLLHIFTGRKSFKELVALHRESDQSTVESALNVLLDAELIQMTAINTFQLVNRTVPKLEATPKEFIPESKVLPTTKPTSLTISISPGHLKTLREYARKQGTCAEMEAAHLLSEIIRFYTAANVLPNL